MTQELLRLLEWCMVFAMVSMVAIITALTLLLFRIADFNRTLGQLEKHVAGWASRQLSEYSTREMQHANHEATLAALGERIATVEGVLSRIRQKPPVPPASE